MDLTLEPISEDEAARLPRADFAPAHETNITLEPISSEEAESSRWDTPLTAAEESKYATWKSKVAPNDSGMDYDFRGAYKSGLEASANGHWPDTYKKPNHPTFSNESIYAKVAPELAGHWDGETYVPPAARTPLSLELVDPLDDFSVYKRVHEEKEALGFDPEDPGVAQKIWNGVKGVGQMAYGAAKGLYTVGVGGGLPGSMPTPEAAATITQAAGDLLAQYKGLGEGGKLVGTKAKNAVLAAVSPEREAQMKDASLRASWNFEREMRDVGQFTDNFNQHLETIFPEALAGLGSIPIDKDAAAGLSTFMDPANYVPTAAAAKWTTSIPLRGAVRAAETALKEASLEVAAATAKRDAIKVALDPLTAAAARGPLFRDYSAASAKLGTLKATQARAAKALQATTAEQRSVVDQLATEAASVPMVTRGVAAGASLAGKGAELAGGALEGVAKLPDRLAGAIAGGADAEARSAIGDGVRQLAGGFGMVPAAAGAAAIVAKRTGQALQTYGRILSEAEGQLPFFKRLARETNGVTGWAASLVDQSGMGALITPVARMGADSTRGLAFPVALGAIQSGGTSDGALQGAGAGLVFGLAGAGYGQWRRFGNGSVFRQQQLADVQRYRGTLASDEAKTFFDKLPGADRAAVATMQLAHPDLKVQYSRMGKDRPSFYYAAEDGPVAVVNMDTRDPLPAVLAHEIGHHVEKHGMGPVIDRTLFGDPLLQKPGLFSKLDTEGKPVLTPEGGYALNDDWRSLRGSYDHRLQTLADKTGEAVRPRTDSEIGREIFAEHGADYLLGRDGQLTRDLRSNVWSRALGGLAQSTFVSNTPVMRQVMGKMGVPLAGGDKMVVGSALFPGGVPMSQDFSKMISRYHRDSVRGRVPTIDEEPGNTRYTAQELRQYPQIVEKLFDGSDDVARTPAGKVMRTKDGAPVFRDTKEKVAERAALAADLTSEIEKAPPPGSQRVKTAKEEGWQIPAVPDAVIDKLGASGKYNPVQLEHLRSASQAIREGQGKSLLFFYQPATKNGKNYLSLAGDWRTETPYAIFVSKAGNVLIRTMSREKLMSNAQQLIASKRANLWDNNLGALVSDVDRYLANHAAGMPGETSIGAAKRDQINQLFGIQTEKNRTANPLIETSPKAPVVIRSRRIDRTNRMAPVEQYFPTSYDRLNANLRPER